jgi:hypothetical protein
MAKAVRAAVMSHPTPARRWARIFTPNIILCTAIPVVVFIAAGVYLLNLHWPYRYRVIQPLLQEVLGSQVKIGHYHRIYFPKPGFMAADITLQRKSAPGLPPLGSINSVIVQGTWGDLFLLRKQVRQVDITGLHIVLPPAGSRENREDFPPGSSASFIGPDAAVGQLCIHDSVLDILSSHGDRYTFPIRMLTIYNLQKGSKLSYSVDMRIPKPGGHIFATGTFGPLNPADLGQTPLTGDFTFAEVNLHDIGDIGGKLASTGRFQGVLGHIVADARSYTPNFAVGEGKPTPVAISAHCTVNGVNGDVVLEDVDAKTLSTSIHVQGGIVGSPKVIDVDIDVPSGRAQDILRPFLSGEPPVAGNVGLHSHAHLDPDGNGAPFLDRLHVKGYFDVPAERMTDANLEKKLSAFSARAQSAKPGKYEALAEPQSPGKDASIAVGDVVSSLKGPARIEKGIITTQGLSFQIPGAAVIFHGSFDLNDDAVHLVGDMRMQADISHAATGFKSVLLKPLIPFFKKKNAGASIPIAVTGQPGSYKVGSDIFDKK